MRKTLHASMGLALCWMVAVVCNAQDVEPKYRTPDTNNAVIHGRVVLPSGFSAEGYSKITLRNDQSTLSTIYTNRSGEFQIRNLSEGIYFVQAEVQDGSFEPVTKRVALGRGLMVDLTFELRERTNPIDSRTSSRVVSAAELRQKVPSEAKKEYEGGLKAVNKGNFLQAAEHFEKALTIYPEYLAARNDLGAQYLKLKRVDEAEKHFEMVLANDPKNFNAKFNMGLVRIERHDYREAISYLNQAVAIDSTRPVARLWIGVALLEMGDIQSAETELTRALVMGGSECVAAHYHLARVYMSRGDTAEASRAVQAYLQEAPRGELVKDAKELAQKIAKN